MSRLYEQINSLREAADQLEREAAQAWRPVPGKTTLAEAWACLKANTPRGVASLSIRLDQSFDGKDEYTVEIWDGRKHHKATTIHDALNLVLARITDGVNGSEPNPVAEVAAALEESEPASYRRKCEGTHPPYSGMCEHCQPPSEQDQADEAGFEDSSDVKS